MKPKLQLKTRFTKPLISSKSLLFTIVYLFDHPIWVRHANCDSVTDVNWRFVFLRRKGNELSVTWHANRNGQSVQFNTQPYGDISTTPFALDLSTIVVCLGHKSYGEGRNKIPSTKPKLTILSYFNTRFLLTWWISLFWVFFCFELINSIMLWIRNV